MNWSDYPDLVNKLQIRLTKPLPGLEALQIMFPRMVAMPEAPLDVRLSAVMMLLFVKNEEWHLLAIRRAEDGKAHGGQIGFPGGRVEEEDENLQDTALRETMEEVGVLKETITLIGAVSPVMVTVSNYKVFPFLGFAKELNITHISRDEVQSVLEIPLSELFLENTKTDVEIPIKTAPQLKRKVKAYQLKDGTIIWGATALMIAELELILKEICFDN